MAETKGSAQTETGTARRGQVFRDHYRAPGRTGEVFLKYRDENGNVVYPEPKPPAPHPIRTQPILTSDWRPIPAVPRKRSRRGIVRPLLMTAAIATTGIAADVATGSHVGGPIYGGVENVWNGRAWDSNYKEPAHETVYSIGLGTYTPPELEGIEVIQPVVRQTPDMDQGRILTDEDLEKLRIDSENMQVRLVYGGKYKKPTDKEIQDIVARFGLEGPEQRFWDVEGASLWAEVGKTKDGKFVPSGAYFSPVFARDATLPPAGEPLVTSSAPAAKLP